MEFVDLLHLINPCISTNARRFFPRRKRDAPFIEGNTPIYNLDWTVGGLSGSDFK